MNNNKTNNNSDTNSNNNNKITNIFTFISFFVLALVIGCLLFFNGFLLMRYELPLKSQCNESPIYTQPSQSQLQYQSNGCWMNKTFEKAVIIVIDALRYDFIEEQPSNSSSIYFHNKLPSIQKLIKDKPDNTLFFKFIADSPTVTMQRIKGITTGSLPTFIDVGSNFGGEAIVEDSLINQLVFKNNQNNQNQNDQINNSIGNNSNLNLKVIFIGDDTWVSLFPNHFYQEYPYPSFNVKDIDTVDNGVLKHLLPTITQIDNEWDVAISHLLGVDHVGHTYGPDHPEMIRKMNQMDEFLISIINNIKNDTLFVLMGDHGMTSDGNHGGSSTLETDAALIMYSPSIKLNNSKEIPKEILKSRLSDNNNQRDISQIDLVSTLSLLLGVPIPFGNLGSVIPEIFYSSVNSSDGGINNQDNWDNLFRALRLNTFQIKRYLEEYSKVSKDFPNYKLDHFKQLLDNTEALYSKYINNRNGDGSVNKIDPVKVYQGYVDYHQEVIELCRDIWATFDLFSMNCGILIIVLSGISIITFIVRVNSSDQQLIFPFKRILITIISGLILSLVFIFSLNNDNQYSNESIILSTTTILSILNFIFYNPIKNSSNNKIGNSYSFRSLIIYFFIIIIPIISVLLHGISYTSNSFIESQHSVVYFFEISIIILTCINYIYLKSNWSKKDTLLIIFTLISIYLTSPNIWNLKLSSLFRQSSTSAMVLENQFKLIIKNNFIDYVWIIPIVYLIWRRILNHVSNNSNSIHHIFLIIILASISIFWFIIQPIVSTNSSNNNNYQLHWLVKNIFPLIVYSLSIVGLTISTISNNNNSKVKNSNSLIIDSLFQKLVNIVLYFYLVIFLLLGIENSRSTLLLLIQVLSIVLIISKLYNSNNNNNNLVSKNNHHIIFNLYFNIIVSIIFGFLSINHFFTSGHEYSFNKIRFESAFIGFDEHFYFRDGLLILLNTFSAPILTTLSVPVILIYTKYFKNNQDSNSSNNDNEKIKSFLSLNEFLVSFLLVLLFYWFNTLMVSISVYILRRHLMVWRVFAPKYIFETVQLLIVSAFLVLLTLIIYSIQKINNSIKKIKSN